MAGLPEPTRADVDGLPVLLVAPAPGVPARPLALWLTHLGGSKEQTLPMLQALAAAGHPAVSFDPPDHGERGSGGDPWEMAGRVLASFRRLMWPLLARSGVEQRRGRRTHASGTTGADEAGPGARSSERSTKCEGNE